MTRPRSESAKKLATRSEGVADGVILALPIGQAAVAAGYSEEVLRLAIRRGDLTARYANSKPVIRLADLDAWLQQLPTEPPALRA